MEETVCWTFGLSNVLHSENLIHQLLRNLGLNGLPQEEFADDSRKSQLLDGAEHHNTTASAQRAPTVSCPRHRPPAV